MSGVRIGISMNYRLTESNVERAYLDAVYIDYIRSGHVLPIPLVPTDDPELIISVLDQVHAVCFTGGLDLDSGLWGEPLHPKAVLVHPLRQRYDLLLYQLATERELPILAICLGMQMINVAHGGRVCQHLPDRSRQDPVDHGGGGRITSHSVAIDPQSQLFRWLGEDSITVNSTHHQGVIEPGEGLAVSAVSADGVIEALERPGYPFLLAVQWHPERDANHAANRIILDRFLEAAVDRAG